MDFNSINRILSCQIMYNNNVIKLIISVANDFSESETDSDVLYETKNKMTSFTREINGDAQSNGWKNSVKMARRIKT